MSIPLNPTGTLLLMDAVPAKVDGYVTLSFVRMKFDYDEDGIVEDLVFIADMESKKVLGTWHADLCPFHVEGITP